MRSRSELPVRREERSNNARVSDDRLLEIAGNMKAAVPFDLGPLDLQDIRAAVLELYRLRRATQL